MNRFLLALLLANLSVAFLFTGLKFASGYFFPTRSLTISTTWETNLNEAATAINNLNLKGVTVSPFNSADTPILSLLRQTLNATFLLLVATGLVLFFHRIYSRLLGRKPGETR